MRKVILSIATSLDNYIAKEDGDIEGLNSPELVIPNEDYGYGDLLSRIDTTLMGNTTYEQIAAFEGPFPYPDTTNYVFTRSEDKKDTEYVQFISEDIVSFVREIRHQEGKDILLIGGGQINTEMLNAALIDEIILSIIPITLGEGTPLFPGKAASFKFHLEDCKFYASGMVQMSYSRIPHK